MTGFAKRGGRERKSARKLASNRENGKRPKRRRAPARLKPQQLAALDELRRMHPDCVELVRQILHDDLREWLDPRAPKLTETIHVSTKNGLETRKHRVHVPVQTRVAMLDSLFDRTGMPRLSDHALALDAEGLVPLVFKIIGFPKPGEEPRIELTTVTSNGASTNGGDQAH